MAETCDKVVHVRVWIPSWTVSYSKTWPRTEVVNSRNPICLELLSPSCY